MNSIKISEKEALVTLIQIYLSHTAKWYSALIAIVLGLLIIPLFVLNASLSFNPKFGIPERVIFSVFTLLFLDAAFYCVNKVLYSLALLSKIYNRLEVSNTGGTLGEYLRNLKSNLHKKIKIFKFYKYGIYGEIIGSIVGFCIIGLFLFSFVWWGYSDFRDWVLIFEAIYLATILFLFKIIL